MTFETLLKALLFAKQWGFRAMALDLTQRVNNLMPGSFQRIAYGKLHRVMPWFRSGLEDLVGSEEDISVEDANRIGFVLALKIYHARSRVRSLLADATSSASDQKSTVVTGVVEEMFTDKLDPWKFPVCYIEPDLAEEQVSPIGRPSSYNEPTGEGAVSQSGGENLSDISLADLGYPDEDNIGSSENFESVADDVLEATVTEEKRTVRELVTAILNGTTTTSPHLLSVVPKVCADTKKNTTCGDRARCRKCCIKKLKVYQPLPGTLKAKTPLGQVLLDQLGEIANGHPICLGIVLNNVEKSCKKVETTCGPSRRCSKCCKKAAKILLVKGEIV
ncbi:hypothetical protein E1B28_000410 [Marasmius oreades]|uniref:Uncharacterized protein n=1 Tax=Marasmius oreades TaxID=181124 RepID=A0A9P7V1C4_9AGAR|nr:uncharacterized protein E1B28_000410 [Marasmius oreades]KAG7098464.1 hypothetical protein E1B28_000410 [Marasmius oreades]